MGLFNRLFSSKATGQSVPVQRTPVLASGTPTYFPAAPRRSVDPAWTARTPALRPEGHRFVNGESFRQEALWRHLAASPQRLVMAQIVRDRRNPHHSGAVAVFLGADHVGYLPRRSLGPEAQSLYKALARLAEEDTPATCWARLLGAEPGKPSVGLMLFTGYSIDRPDRPYPFQITMPPEATARILGAETHGALFERLLGRQQVTELHCELAVVDRNPTRPQDRGPVLSASFDGTVVGGLSSLESSRRIAIVEELVTAARPALAKATLYRNDRGGFNCSVSTPVLYEPDGSYDPEGSDLP